MTAFSGASSGSAQPQLLAAVQGLWSGAALADPHPIYEQLRGFANTDGLVRLPEWNTAFAVGHAATSAVLRSPAARSGEWEHGPSDGGKLLQHMMLFRNGVPHARLRGLVQKAFTPRVVEEQRDLVRSLLDELLSDMARAGGPVDRVPVDPVPVDLVAGLSGPLPGRVIMRMLGLRGADEERFLGWSASVAELLGGADRSPALLARIEAGIPPRLRSVPSRPRRGSPRQPLARRLGRSAEYRPRSGWVRAGIRPVPS